MHVCMYVCMCICVYVCMCVCLFFCVCIVMHARVVAYIIHELFSVTYTVQFYMFRNSTDSLVYIVEYIRF